MEQTARAFSDALEKFAAVTQQEAGPDSESRVPQYAGVVAAGAGIGAGAFAGRSQGMKDIQYHNDMISGLTNDAILNRYYDTKLKNLTSRREGLEEGIENLVDGAKQNLGNYFGGDKQREIHSMSVGIAAAPDMLLGRKTLYHGTSAGNARNIEQEGFKPSTGLGGASAHHNSQLFMDESKGKTHFTSIKPIATGFARFMDGNDLQDAQSDLDIATKKFHMARKNPETKSQELESIMKEIQKAEFHLQSMTDD